MCTVTQRPAQALSGRCRVLKSPAVRRILALLLAVAGLGPAPGASALTIVRPAHQIWEYTIVPRRQYRRCRNRFDARRLLGLSMPAAGQLAAGHGYVTPSVAASAPRIAHDGLGIESA